MSSPPFPFWKEKRVVVPGGAGVIGSYLCDWLVAAGATVTVIDDLSQGTLTNLSTSIGKITFTEGSVLDAQQLDTLFQSADIVMNMAGVAPGLMIDPTRHQKLKADNIAIGDSVLQAAIRNQVPRLLVVSSSCVYPDDAVVPTPELPIDKTQPEYSNRGYGEAKREIEKAAQAAAKKHPNMSIAIARPFNMYGARDNHSGKGSHVIPGLLARILSPDPKLTVWGSGNQTRSFLHGQDAAKALALITEKYATAQPVNIGSEIEVRIKDLVTTLIDICGVEKNVIFDTTKPEGATRKGANIQLLKQIANGFEPTIPFKQGLEELVATVKAQTLVSR